ncbi:hypothetical protein [Nocardiopsis quinghaiensis]|uniref:hypothetical protein n=1 Tax=Nocardiopsis quinghaiensis TaxID=464995 RepID=UPI00123857B2|nr:hypothetical protein [Nocardiopsis quinghaiensis]
MGTGEDPGEVARRLVREAEGLPDVVGLSSGGFGTLTTPVPGGRVRGVAVRADSVEVGLVVRFGRPLPEVAAEVRRALVPFAGGRTVHISVEDVVAGLGEDIRAGG